MYICVCVCMCVCVCVYLRVRAFEKQERRRTFAPELVREVMDAPPKCVRVCVCCMCACVRARVCVCVCICVCVHARSKRKRHSYAPELVPLSKSDRGAAKKGSSSVQTLTCWN